jgi:magnesium chelatase family protein
MTTWASDELNKIGKAEEKRISGPLLDHIDVHIEVPRVDYEKLSGDRMGNPPNRL